MISLGQSLSMGDYRFSSWYKVVAVMQRGLEDMAANYVTVETTFAAEPGSWGNDDSPGGTGDNLS